MSLALPGRSRVGAAREQEGPVWEVREHEQVYLQEVVEGAGGGTGDLFQPGEQGEPWPQGEERQGIKE